MKLLSPDGSILVIIDELLTQQPISLKLGEAPKDRKEATKSFLINGTQPHHPPPIEPRILLETISLRDKKDSNQRAHVPSILQYVAYPRIFVQSHLRSKLYIFLVYIILREKQKEKLRYPWHVLPLKIREKQNARKT